MAVSGGADDATASTKTLESAMRMKAMTWENLMASSGLT
jgi:hypothetical protein